MFERLYGDGTNAAERQARRAATGSILDAVTSKVSRLQSRLPASDRSRLNDYLEAVREMERRLQIVAHLLRESHYPTGPQALTMDRVARTLLVGPEGPQPLPSDALSQHLSPRWSVGRMTSRNAPDP